MSKGKMVRSTVYLPRELREQADAIIGEKKFSAWVKEALERELYGDNPRFIEYKLNDELRQRQYHDTKVKQYREDLEKANQKQKEKKERLGKFNPGEVRDYRTIIPKGGK